MRSMNSLLTILMAGLLSSSLAGDYYAIIADSTDSCFRSDVKPPVFAFTPDELNRQLINYFQSDSGNQIECFACLSNKRMKLCDRDYQRIIDNQLIEILKWEKVHREQNLYSLLIGQASKSLADKLGEVLMTPISPIVRKRIKKARKYVTERIDGKFIILE